MKWLFMNYRRPMFIGLCSVVGIVGGVVYYKLNTHINRNDIRGIRGTGYYGD